MPETDAPSLPTHSPDPAPAGASPPAPAAPPAAAPQAQPQTASDLAADARASAERSEREDMDLIRATLAKHGHAVESPVTPKPQPQQPPAQTPAAAQDTEDATADDSPADAHPSLTLSDDDARMLDRLGLDADDLPDDPTRRERALARHRKAFDQLRTLATENGRLKKSAGAQPQPAADPDATEPPAARGPRQPTAPPSQDVETAWRNVDEVLKDFGDDVTPRLRGAVESLVHASLAAVPRPDTAAQEQLWRRLEREDFDRGLEAATFPDGVHKTDPKVRKQLLEETRRQYAAEILRLRQEGKPPPPLDEWSFEHAAQRAVPVVFAKQLADQRKREADDRRRKQLAGLPDAGTRNPTTQAKADPEEADLEFIRDHLKKHGLPVGAA